MSLRRRQFLTCGICLCTIHHSRSKTRSQQCRHYFHVKCIEPWISDITESRTKPTCPLCRADWEIMEVVQWNKKGCGKFVTSFYPAHDAVTDTKSKREKSICRVCHVNSFNDYLVVCSRCGKGCHTYCFNDRKETIPPPTWKCDRCERKIARRRRRVAKTNEIYAQRPSVVLDTITLEDDFVVENVDVKPDIELLEQNENENPQ